MQSKNRPRRPLARKFGERDFKFVKALLGTGRSVSVVVEQTGWSDRVVRRVLKSQSFRAYRRNNAKDHKPADDFGYMLGRPSLRPADGVSAKSVDKSSFIAAVVFVAAIALLAFLLTR